MVGIHLFQGNIKKMGGYWSGTWKDIDFPLQLESFDHWLSSQAKQQVICCQSGHGVAGGVGCTSNMGQDHCRKKRKRGQEGGELNTFQKEIQRR